MPPQQSKLKFAKYFDFLINKYYVQNLDKFFATISLGKPSLFQIALKKEIDLFEASGEKSKNLQMLYMILQNIGPTNCERVFSNSKDFVSKKRSRLTDKTIDNLCFLKEIFKKN